jgi:hypothetical protein
MSKKWKFKIAVDRKQIIRVAGYHVDGEKSQIPQTCQSIPHILNHPPLISIDLISDGMRQHSK